MIQLQGELRTVQVAHLLVLAVDALTSSHLSSSECNKEEVMQSAVSNRPSDFGCDTLESRIDKSSGLGRKKW